MLLAFDATARAGSFRAAARELHLTQGAVSRQVNALEEQLGTRLFERNSTSTDLTPAGRNYAQDIAGALRLIRDASLRTLSGPMNAVLNLAMLPTFGTRWLMPRIPNFLNRHPEITVHFSTRLVPFQFHREELDAAIHYGQADWPDVEHTFLCGEEVTPVCAPALKQALDEQRLLWQQGQTLLKLRSRKDAWKRWFEEVEQRSVPETGLIFEEISTIAQAAVAGLGIALLPRFLIRGELQRGELVEFCSQSIKSSGAYYLVVPKHRVDHPPVKALRTWLQEETSVETE